MTTHACPRSGLGKTLEDHLNIGSTPPPELVQNPGKTLLETLSETALRERLDTSIAEVARCYEEAKAQLPRSARILEVARDAFLIPDLEYVREKGRLPGELENFDPQEAFALS